MKKRNNLGFFLSETMVVITIVTIVLLGVFKIFSSVYTKYKESENYNTVNATNAASSLRKYYKSVGFDYVTLLNGNYYVDLTNSPTYDNEYYDYLKQTIKLEKVYLIDMNQVFSGTNINVFNTSLRKYLKTLENSGTSILLLSITNGSEYGSAAIVTSSSVALVGDNTDENSVIVTLNGTFTDPGYTNWDGEAPTITWENTLDTTKEGIYYLKYNFDGFLLRRKIYVVRTTYTYDYVGNVQNFYAPVNGYYKVEVWGAQGGQVSATYLGGYGGYSKGVVYLTKGTKLYIYTGGAGSCLTGGSSNGGYNGGGGSLSRSASYTMCSGGGATHIATVSGLLSTLSSNQSSIIIVAGGGGGAGYFTTGPTGGSGGSSGGYLGVVPTTACTDCGTRTGGSQSSGGAGRAGTGGFGYGYGSTSSYCVGGGGGYYGGAGDTYEWGSSGGSSYIGNTSLITYGSTTKSMYCYNCTTSTTASTLTYSTNNVSATPTADYPKSGNGFAKITYIPTN